MVENNNIWLLKEDDTSVITQGKILVTDQKMYDEVIKELKDINFYVETGRTLVPGLHNDGREYTSTGANIYEYYGPTEEYNFSYWVYKYSNPRAKVFNIINCNVDEDINLLNLFATLECGNNIGKRINEFHRAREIIDSLENSCLDVETLSQIIKQMWPNFGFYATEALKCTDIEIIKSYNIDELNSIVKSSENLGIEVANDVKRILSKRVLASDNGKVLSLARRAHRMVNPSK